MNYYYLIDCVGCAFGCAYLCLLSEKFSTGLQSIVSRLANGSTGKKFIDIAVNGLDFFIGWWTENLGFFSFRLLSCSLQYDSWLTLILINTRSWENLANRSQSLETTDHQFCHTLSFDMA